MFVNNIKTSFQSHFSPNEESKVVKLIGSKCLMNCSLNDISTEALLDSGAQVSAISESWFKSNFDIPKSGLFLTYWEVKLLILKPLMEVKFHI